MRSAGSDAPGVVVVVVVVASVLVVLFGAVAGGVPAAGEPAENCDERDATGATGAVGAEVVVVDDDGASPRARDGPPGAGAASV